MSTTTTSHAAVPQRGPARTRREGDQLRGELLAAATALAAGPRPVAIPSLRAVARACGVSATAVYRHFPSQSALTRALLVAEHEAFGRAVLSADEESAEPVQRLRRLAVRYVRWGIAHPGPYQLLFESADRLGEDWAVVGASDEVTARMTALLAARASGSDAVSPQVAGERLWTGLHGLVSLRLHKPDHPWLADLSLEVDHLLQRLG